MKKKKAPPAGWCAVRHRPLKPAQSRCKGSDGKLYCTPCFRYKFPKLYKKKLDARKSACVFCCKKKELVRGFCKPCRSARECDQCHKDNEDIHAPRCHGCVSRPALWCARCCSREELICGLCRNCFAPAVKCCQYCWGPSGTCVPRWRPCSVAECSRWVFCCEACAQRCVNGRLLCLPCWRAAGRLCIECGKTPAKTGHTYQRACRKCWSGSGIERHYKLVKAESLCTSKRVMDVSCPV